jgi:hypothetical protein
VPPEYASIPRPIQRNKNRLKRIALSGIFIS